MKHKRWKDLYSNFVLPSIREVGKETIALYDKYEEIRLLRKKTLISQCFHTWKNITIRSIRRDIVDRVDRMDVSYFKSKKRNILHVLSVVSLGASSRKKILQRRRNGLETARANLVKTLTEKNERKGVITNEMVQSELRRIFHSYLVGWNRRRYLSNCFTIWKHIMYEIRELKLKARIHLQKIIFRSWKRWTIKQIIIITGSHTVHNKYSHTEGFRSKFLLRKSLHEWNMKARIYARAKRMRRSVLSRFAQDYLKRWWIISKNSRQIKLVVLRKWMTFQTDTIGRPFLCWQEVTAELKCLRQERDRFVSTYRRLKDRREQWRIFKSWSQQAQYGRVTSLFSRCDLIQLVTAQSRKIECLEQQIQSNKSN